MSEERCRLCHVGCDRLTHDGLCIQCACSIGEPTREDYLSDQAVVSDMADREYERRTGRSRE